MFASSTPFTWSKKEQAVADKPDQKVSFQINGRTYVGTKGESLLEAIRRQGYEVPSLCHHEAVGAYGACRLCLVEVNQGGRRKLTTSCNFPLEEGLDVLLDTEKVQDHRRVVLQLLLARAPAAEAVVEIASQYGVEETPFDIVDQTNKCILCGLCKRVCSEIVGADAIGFSGRGLSKQMLSPYDEANEACIGCGACAVVCPTDCIGMKEENGIRSIVRWHRDLPMKKCKVCGRPFAPTFQLNYFADQIKVERSFFDTCQDCR